MRGKTKVSQCNCGKKYLLETNFGVIASLNFPHSYLITHVRLCLVKHPHLGGIDVCDVGVTEVGGKCVEQWTEIGGAHR